MRVVRKPKLTEVTGLKRLLDGAEAQDRVLSRELSELFENARDFYAYVDDGGVGGCCALHIDMVDLAEIRSLVVRKDLRGHGVGSQLVRKCLEEARSLDIARVYTLTRIPGFFEALGFAVIDKGDLPMKVYKDCLRCDHYHACDEVAMKVDLQRYMGTTLEQMQREISQ